MWAKVIKFANFKPEQRRALHSRSGRKEMDEAMQGKTMQYSK